MPEASIFRFYGKEGTNQFDGLTNWYMYVCICVANGLVIYSVKSVSIVCTLDMCHTAISESECSILLYMEWIMAHHEGL